MKKDISIWLGKENRDNIYWDPHSQRSPHLVLIGGSGSGKTETLKVICMELKQKKISTLIIDFHNDFTVLADNLVNLDNATIHPLEIQIGEKPIDVVYKVAKIFTKIFSFGEIQEAIIRDAIKIFYEASGIKDLKTLNEGKIKLLPFEAFKDILHTRFDKKVILPILAKLSIVFDTDIFMNAKETALPFNTMTTQVSVIQLKEFPTDEIKSMIAEILLNKLINHFYIKGQSQDGMQLFCVIDEAHRVTYEGSPVDLLLRESRKYGVGVILASQRPTDFSETILANVGTILSFQCSLTKDAKYISQIINVDANVLQKVSEPGTCFFKLASENDSKRIKIIRVSDRDEYKDVVSKFDATESKKRSDLELKQLKKEAEIKEEYDELKKKIVPDLEKENSKLKKERDLLREEKDDLKKITIPKLEKDLKKALADIEDREEKITELRENLEKQIKSNKSLADKNEKLNEKIDELNEQITHQTKELTRTDKLIKSNEKEYDFKKKELSSEIDSLKIQNFKLESKLEDLKKISKELSDSKKRIEDIQTDLSTSKEELRKSEKKSEKLTNDLERHNAKLKQIKYDMNNSIKTKLFVKGYDFSVDKESDYFCKHCGYALDEDAKFCDKCGEKLK